MSKSRIGTIILLIGALAVALPLALPSAERATAQPVEVLPSFGPLVKATKPAVVTVRTTARQNVNQPGGLPIDPQMREFMERFFGRDPFRNLPQPRQPGPGQRAMGVGSGFIVDGNGLIVTNNHVIDGAADIMVVLDSGEELSAELVGTDQKTDLAVLRVEAGRTLPTVPWGDSDRVEVGDWAIAIGNPFGLGGTVTAGIISARGRDIRSGPYDDYLQVDAPINRGNSGGPLFDQRGNVIGVNTAIFSPTGGSVGIGFAIPSNLAREIVADLIRDGRVERGWLGVSIQPVTPEIADAIGLDAAAGALIAEVNGDGPAAHGGLRRGDVIVGFDGVDIDTVKDLTRTVARTSPGTRAEVRVWRKGEIMTLTVRTGRYPA